MQLELSTQIRLLQDAAVETRAQHAREVATLEAKHTREMAGAEAKHAEAVETLKSEHMEGRLEGESGGRHTWSGEFVKTPGVRNERRRGSRTMANQVGWGRFLDSRS